MHWLSTVHAAVDNSVYGHTWHDTSVESGTGVYHGDWVLRVDRWEGRVDTVMGFDLREQ